MAVSAPRVTAAGSGSGLRLRPMRPRDVPRVLAIEEGVHARPWTGESLRSELRTDTRIYRVIDRRRGWLRAREVLAVAGANVAAREAHIMTVAVDPDWRRHGLASWLLVALLAEARTRGAEAATLEVRESNTAARRLYEEFGFVSSGVRPGYYGDTGEGAAVMWLRGLQGPVVAQELASHVRRLGVRVDSLPGDLTKPMR